MVSQSKHLTATHDMLAWKLSFRISISCISALPSHQVIVVMVVWLIGNTSPKDRMMTGFLSVLLPRAFGPQTHREVNTAVSCFEKEVDSASGKASKFGSSLPQVAVTRSIFSHNEKKRNRFRHYRHFTCDPLLKNQICYLQHSIKSEHCNAENSHFNDFIAEA